MSLKQFLVDLATNADVKRQYAADPDGAMTAAGLTAEERASFASGNSSQVRTALGKPDNDCMSQTGQRVSAGSTVFLANGERIDVTEESFLMSEDDCDTLLVTKKKCNEMVKAALTAQKKDGASRAAKPKVKAKVKAAAKKRKAGTRR